MTWEQRYHPLRDEWVVVAGHRQHRPWHGQRNDGQRAPVPAHAADCYLCPGNARVSGARNPDYDGVLAFDNDHPCVAPDAPEVEAVPPGTEATQRAQRALGVSRVVCYTPRHDLTLALLPLDEVVRLLRHWQAEYRALSALPGVRHVLVFENKGEVVGVSNPHPHCQIYATSFVFKTIETEARLAAAHWRETGRALLADVIAAERADGRRLLVDNGAALAFVPYFARYAYETFVTPAQSYGSIADMPEPELVALAQVLREVLVRYDNLWQQDFPYVMALHQAPLAGEQAGFHFHIELHPPLRQPNLLKFLAGPEIGGGSFISDTSPERTAAELRAVSAAHYRATVAEGS